MLLPKKRMSNHNSIFFIIFKVGELVFKELLVI